jgi:hypothetical protein
VVRRIEYIVDGLGRRVARRIDGQFDRAWIYRDALRPEGELDSAGTFTHSRNCSATAAHASWGSSSVSCVS